jgi:ATP-binding cassette subfamily B protein
MFLRLRRTAPPTSAQEDVRRDGSPDDEQLEANQRPLDFGLIVWLYGYTRPYAAKRNVLLLLVLVRSVQLPLLAWLLTWIINGPITRRSTEGLGWGLAAFAALSTLTQVILYFRTRLALELGEAVVHDLRNDIFAHLQRMQMSFLNRTRLGRIISRISSDAEAVRAGVQDVLFRTLVGGGQMLVAGAMMLYVDAVLFSIVAILALVLWTASRHFRRKLSNVHRNLQESFSRVTASVAESIQGVSVTQAAGQEASRTERFAGLVARHGEYNLKAARTAGVLLPLLEFNSQLFLALLLAVGGYRVLAAGPAMPLADLIQFLFLANVFFQPIQVLGDQYNQALVAMAGAERIRRLLATEPDWQDRLQTAPPLPLRGEVCFENVSFAYEPQRAVLHAIGFSVEPGQRVALVGHTGCGKTTIINLLAKFYLPTAGRLLIDGREIRDLPTDWLRSQIGFVPQQNFLFSGSVADNIRMGRPGATDADVAQVLADLGCLDLFVNLAGGLQSEVGESGRLLSLGQRQLVCFARAMLGDPRMILLDEATSAVDAATEWRIQQALERLLDGRTSFIVAHRPSTIRGADVVLTLRDGRLVARTVAEAVPAASCSLPSAGGSLPDAGGSLSAAA